MEDMNPYLPEACGMGTLDFEDMFGTYFTATPGASGGQTITIETEIPPWEPKMEANAPKVSFCPGDPPSAIDDIHDWLCDHIDWGYCFRMAAGLIVLWVVLA